MESVNYANDLSCAAKLCFNLQTRPKLYMGLFSKYNNTLEMTCQRITREGHPTSI